MCSCFPRLSQFCSMCYTVTPYKSPIHYYCNIKSHYPLPSALCPPFNGLGGLVSRSNSIIHIISPHALHRRLRCSQWRSSPSPRPLLPTLDKHDNSNDQQRKTAKGTSRHADNQRNVRAWIRGEIVRHFRLRGRGCGASGSGRQG